MPYDIIKDASGDYWLSAAACMQAGYAIDQIWSVVIVDDDDGDTIICYGPPHHYVNVIGFIATAERHNHETYFEETL